MPKEKHKKSDRKKKAGKKGSQLAIRIEKSERDAFVELCDRLDTSAAREIRRFMREFVAAHPAPAEAEPEPEGLTPEDTPAQETPRKARTRKPSAAVTEPAAQPDAPETPVPAKAPRKRAPRKAPTA